MSNYSCSGCGEEFQTLSKKRLHECPEGVEYGGDTPELEVPVADMDADTVAKMASEQLLICDVCGEQNHECSDVEHSMSEQGVALAVTFECSECGATNENSGTFQ